MDTEIILEKIQSQIKEQKILLDDINQKLTYIEVKNGGNLNIKLRWNEFMQKVYDKPEPEDIVQIIKKNLKEYPNMEEVNKLIKKGLREYPINSLREIARDITLIGGMITVLLKIFNLI